VRTNEEGRETVFADGLNTSCANSQDSIFVFSVGCGDAEKNTSVNLVCEMYETKRAAS